MEPGISRRVVAGSYCPTDGAANPIKTTKAFVEAARRQGVQIELDCPTEGLLLEGERVVGIATPRGAMRAGLVILAAGGWSPTIAASAGIDLPIRVGPLQMMVTERRPAQLRQVLGWIGHGISLKQDPAGGFVIGGAWPGRGEPAEYDAKLLPGSMAKSALTAMQLYPALANISIVRAWVGLEAFCPDDMPIISEVPGREGLWVAAEVRAAADLCNAKGLRCCCATRLPAPSHLWLRIPAIGPFCWQRWGRRPWKPLASRSQT